MYKVFLNYSKINGKIESHKNKLIFDKRKEMYSLFENYEETTPHLVLFWSYVFVPVHIFSSKMKK
jgi:hypothetical protein